MPEEEQEYEDRAEHKDTSFVYTFYRTLKGKDVDHVYENYSEVKEKQARLLNLEG